MDPRLCFFLLTLVFVLQWLSLHWEISIMLLSQFPLTFHQIHNGMPIALHSLWLFLCWLGSLCNHLRDVPWEDIFKFSACAPGSEFWEWVQVWIDVYITQCKYQVKPHSSPWFWAACAAVIVQRNHFFYLYWQNKSFYFKVKFRQAINFCKRVLEAAKLAYV